MQDPEFSQRVRTGRAYISYYSHQFRIYIRIAKNIYQSVYYLIGEDDICGG